jgi:hypothetical protein
LLARIQELKNAAGKEMTRTHLMVLFLQRCIQPLQARVSKLWTYSGSNDPSRVSPKDPQKKDLDKRVRSLTTLTTKLAVPACLLLPSTPLILCHRYAICNLKRYFILLLFLTMYC